MIRLICMSSEYIYIRVIKNLSTYIHNIFVTYRLLYNNSEYVLQQSVNTAIDIQTEISKSLL